MARLASVATSLHDHGPECCEALSQDGVDSVGGTQPTFNEPTWPCCTRSHPNTSLRRELVRAAHFGQRVFVLDRNLGAGVYAACRGHLSVVVYPFRHLQGGRAPQGAVTAAAEFGHLAVLQLFPRATGGGLFHASNGHGGQRTAIWSLCSSSIHSEEKGVRPPPWTWSPMMGIQVVWLLHQHRTEGGTSRAEDLAAVWKLYGFFINIEANTIDGVRFLLVHREGVCVEIAIEGAGSSPASLWKLSR